MSAISSVPTPTAVSTAIAQSAATQLAVINTLATLGGNSSLPSTYDFADLLGSFQQSIPGTPDNASTGAQAAQKALLGIEYAIAQTLGSLVSGSSPDTSNPDIFSLLDPLGTSDAIGLPGSAPAAFLNGFTGSTPAEAAKYAVLNAQYAVTQALGSLLSSSTSKSSSRS